MTIESAIFRRTISIDPDPAGWSEATTLLLVACDVGYLEHAEALARSLDVASPNQHLLLHLINPDGDSLARAVRLSEELSATRLHVSAEKVYLSDPAAKRAYFASARFLRLAELLQPRADSEGNRPLVRRGILALDADALAVSPVTDDFSDKPEADVCLRRRDLEGDTEVESHLRVAAGAVWIRASTPGKAFAVAVASELQRAFETGSPTWFIDQSVLGDHVEASSGGARVRNLKRKFIDWEFGGDAVFWMAKGERKNFDVRYILFREAVSGSREDRTEAGQLLRRIAARVPESVSGPVAELMHRVGAPRRHRVGVLLPRLDLPWKRSSMGRGVPPAPSDDTIELRLWWKRFAMELMRMLTRRGVEAFLLEIPAWEITPTRVDSLGLSLAFVPHRCHLDFGPVRTPVQFYMQEYFRPVFVVDPRGWSASSSVYPIDPTLLPPAVLGAWDDYRRAFVSGRLDSKFAQTARRGRRELAAAGELPHDDYIFFPLQIPHDQSLEYFSEIGEIEAVRAVVALAKEQSRTLVLKQHPANRRAMVQFREEFHGQGVLWTEANVHDVLRYAGSVVTLNSGVGFEALLALKPLVTMARSEYDCVAHRATPDDLTSAWRAALEEGSAQRETRYARFVDWFLGRHAVDISRPHAGRYVLDRIIERALSETEPRP